MQYYPILCSSIFKEKIWGGHLLKTMLNKSLPDPQKSYGESWEISAQINHSSTILNGVFKGNLLSTIIAEEHGSHILGREIWEKYQGVFPLLLKFLDIHDKLSIQVHPDNSYALAHENSFGKAECWYIISASPDACLIMGMKPGFTKESFLSLSKQNNYNLLFEEVPIKTGDIVLIKPGMVHASTKGSILLYELQQNSDITYRIYDFDRTENGIKRQLNLDKAADVIDFNVKADIRHFNMCTDPEITLIDEEYFVLKKITISTQTIPPTIPTMKLYTVLSGSVTIYYQTNSSIILKIGDVVLIPANITITIEGKAELLEALPK